MNFGIKEFFFREDDPCVVISEVGVNHNGSIDIAMKMVDAAIKANVDIVKFQSFKSEKEISKYASKTPYQEETTSSEGSQLDMCKELELDESTLKELKAYCFEKGVGFLCTAFEKDSVDFIAKSLQMNSIKIPSSEITNLPLLVYIGSLFKSAVLSTGASTITEVGTAIESLKFGGCEEILLLHCVSSYPADIKDVNLRVIATMKSAFGLPVGFSDHTIGISVPIAAAALGASAIEKHFTLDRTMAGPDHRASIEPDDLASMVLGIKEAHISLGDSIKKPQPCELPNIQLIRKGLVAIGDLHAGMVLTKELIDIKRPAIGIAPADFEKVIGMTIINDILDDAPIHWKDLR
jgi:N,N'-diacetyllegionaminate synthase